MKEYKLVSFKPSNGGMKGPVSLVPNIEQTINSYAKIGWELQQIVSYASVPALLFAVFWREK